MADDEARLLDRAIAGDGDALAELLRRHGPTVRAQIRNRIRHIWRPLLSEDDILQTTYLEAFLSIRRFRPVGANSFGPWLLRIARNNLLSAVRRLSRRKRPDPRRRVVAPAAQREDSRITLLESLAGTGTAPSAALQREEAFEALEAALAKLPREYELVVRRYDLGERPIGQVAEELNRSEGAVYMLRSRAHERLRQLLGTQILGSSTFGHPPVA